MSLVRNPSQNDALALLALKSAPNSPKNLTPFVEPQGISLARLQGRDFEYFMRQNRIVIGRNSSKGNVDVNMGQSSFISRKHVVIVYEVPHFYLTCGGKNGVFIDGIFQRLGAPAQILPKECTLRFPSTNIKINFQSLVDDDQQSQPLSSEITSPMKRHLSQLKIDIPVNNASFEFSPCPSPTGTISAVNSCPASPRSGLPRPQLLVPNLEMAAARVASHHHQQQQQQQRRLEIARDEGKPPYSYAQLIVQAVTSSPDKQLTLSGIYAYITKHYPYYRSAEKGWQNSIRHNLSLNRYFIKVPRSQEEPGKGSFWRIDPGSEAKFVDQAFRRRRQRTIPCFRTPFGGLSTRSAPASPSHVAGVLLAENLPQSNGSSLEQITELPLTRHSTPIVTQHPVIAHMAASDFRFTLSAPSSPVESKPLTSVLTSQSLVTYNKPLTLAASFNGQKTIMHIVPAALAAGHSSEAVADIGTTSLSGSIHHSRPGYSPSSIIGLPVSTNQQTHVSMTHQPPPLLPPKLEPETRPATLPPCDETDSGGGDTKRRKVDFAVD